MEFAMDAECDFNRCRCVLGLVYRFQLGLWALSITQAAVCPWVLHRGLWLQGKKAMMKFRNSMDNSQRLDAYHLPDINIYQIPVPPTPQPQAGKIFRANRFEPWRRKRLRPITAPNGLEPLCTRVIMAQMFFYYCDTDDVTPAEVCSRRIF